MSHQSTMEPSKTRTELTYQNHAITLIGTAHISKASVEEVANTIHELKPDTVCVELDQGRYLALAEDGGWQKLDLGKAIKEGTVLLLLSSLALSAYQRKMGEKLGVRPGAELLAAVKAAEAVGAKVVLADRDVQITLRRAWHALSAREKLMLLGIGAAPGKDDALSSELTQEKVEELKTGNTLNEMLAEMAKALPGIKGPLIDERDLYLISSIREASGPVTVAVVGAGHVPGMVANLHTAVDRRELEAIPIPSLTKRVIAAVWSLLILFGLGFVFYRAAPHAMSALIGFLLITAGSQWALLVAAGAKPLTWLLGLLLGPLSALFPNTTVQKLIARVELAQRKPREEDLRAVRDQVLSLKGLYSNRFTRVALVAIGGGLGRSLGRIGAILWVLSQALLG